MKRIVSIITLLLLLASAHAQTTADGTVIYATTDGFDVMQPEVTAYVGEYATRGEWMMEEVDGLYRYYLLFRVRTDDAAALDGSPIVFHSWKDGIEYIIDNVSCSYMNHSECKVIHSLTYRDAETSYGTLTSPVLIVFEQPVFNISNEMCEVHIDEQRLVSTQISIEGSIPVMTEEWFEIDDPNVACISRDAQGNLCVRGVGEGMTLITVFNPYTGEPFGMFPVNVSAEYVPLENMSANPLQPFPESIVETQRMVLSNDYLLFEPAYATNREVVWTASDESLVQLTPSPGGGSVTYLMALAPGTVTLTATSVEDPNLSVEFTLEVLPWIYVSGFDLKDGGVVLRDEKIAIDQLVKVVPENAMNDSYYYEVIPPSKDIWEDDLIDGVNYTFSWDENKGRILQFGYPFRGDAYVRVYAAENQEICDTLHFFVRIPVNNVNSGIWYNRNLSEDPVQVENGGSLCFCYFEYQDNFDPQDATNKAVTWESLTPDIVTVEYSERGDVTFYGHKVGVGTVRIRSVDNPEAYDDNEIEVVPMCYHSFVGVKGTQAVTTDVWYRLSDWYTATPETADPSDFSFIISANFADYDDFDLREILSDPSSILEPMDSQGWVLDRDENGEWIIKFDEFMVSFMQSDEFDITFYSLHYHDVRATVHLKISVPVSSIDFSSDPHSQLPVGVTRFLPSGENYVNYDKYDIEGIGLGSPVIEPYEALDKRLKWESSNPEVAAIGYDEVRGLPTLVTLSEGHTTLTVSSVISPSVKEQFNIEVVNVTFSVPEHEIHMVKMASLSDFEYTITPEDFYFGGKYAGILYEADNPEVLEYHPDFEGYLLAINVGKSKVRIWTRFFPELCDSIDVYVDPDLESFALEAETNTIMKGESLDVKISPVPAEAQIDISRMWFNQSSYTAPKNHKYVDVEFEEFNNYVVAHISSDVPGSHRVTFGYYDAEHQGDLFGVPFDITVISVFSLDEGWHWISTPSMKAPIEKENFAEVWGESVQRIVSQSAVALKDPKYYFFGGLETIEPNSFYKLYNESGTVKVSYPGVEYPQDAIWAHLDAGWNWVAYPYQFEHSPGTLRVVKAWDYLPDGSIVQSQDGTFFIVSVDGEGKRTTSGTLTRFRPGDGYMISSSMESDVYWPTEGSMIESPGHRRFSDDDYAESAPVRRALAPGTPFRYDYHRWPNVMSIVADIEGLSDDAIIGAFVDDECRGVGEKVDGRFFIGVSGEGDEVVEFRAWDATLSQWYSLDRALPFTSAMGTLAVPVLFHASETTGIESTTDERQSTRDDVYDLQGRKLEPCSDGASLASGIYIIGGRKVLKK